MQLRTIFSLPDISVFKGAHTPLYLCYATDEDSCIAVEMFGFIKLVLG